VKHGAPIAIGSDSYRTTSLPEALHINSLGVLTPAELLRSWTDETAHAIFPNRRIGRLEPGYEASFIVLSGDPLADFASVKNVVLRFKQGVLVTAE
jgi:imidazolonepropionase-like amidohydrolase